MTKLIVQSHKDTFFCYNCLLTDYTESVSFNTKLYSIKSNQSVTSVRSNVNYTLILSKRTCQLLDHLVAINKQVGALMSLVDKCSLGLSTSCIKKKLAWACRDGTILQLVLMHIHCRLGLRSVLHLQNIYMQYALYW